MSSAASFAPGGDRDVGGEQRHARAGVEPELVRLAVDADRHDRRAEEAAPHRQHDRLIRDVEHRRRHDAQRARPPLHARGDGERSPGSIGVVGRMARSRAIAGQSESYESAIVRPMRARRAHERVGGRGVQESRTPRRPPRAGHPSACAARRRRCARPSTSPRARRSGVSSSATSLQKSRPSSAIRAQRPPRALEADRQLGVDRVGRHVAVGAALDDRVRARQRHRAPRTDRAGARWQARSAERRRNCSETSERRMERVRGPVGDATVANRDV